MMMIKWILIIAMLKYSHGQTTEVLTELEEITCRANEKCTDHTYCQSDILIDLRLGNITCNHYSDVCCESSMISETPVNKTQNYEVPTECGVLNPNSVGMKIKETTDHEAQFGEFPWMVAVLEQKNKLDNISISYLCGGSLIHPFFVLTIGHCVDRKISIDLKARAGEWDTQATQEPIPFVESNVLSINIHEKYNAGTGTYNIALLFLETQIQNDKHINTICLPQPNINFDGASCFVSGWGKHIIDPEGSNQNILKKLDLQVIKSQRCTEMFRKTRLGNIFELHESLICADGKDDCIVDGGSPLVCPVPGNEGHYYQAGIVAWGVGCGHVDIPGAYTNVPFFVDWINTQIQQTSRSIKIIQ